MSLEKEVRDAARALQEVSSGLAAALRIAAQRRNASSSVVETFRESDSLSLTVGAVIDAAEPMLSLLMPDSRVVGRAPVVGAETARVRNGFDSLGLTLLILLQKASDAVSDVAVNQSQWIVSPLQAKQCMDAMKIHHGQLKAVYGLFHLVGKIVREVDVTKNIFLDVHGENPRPDLEPNEWRAAIKVDPLFGRFFGFHYGREMRQFLRVVNIARGSISSAAATTPGDTPPLVRNIAALGWGWVYSNMTLLNNMGVNIDGASQIGKDAAGGFVEIDQVRLFMNLVEDPIVSGVTALASADVAIDLVFAIPDNELSGQPSSQSESGDSCNVPQPLSPVAARLLSALPRRIDRQALLGRSNSSPSRTSTNSQTPGPADGLLQEATTEQQVVSVMVAGAHDAGVDVGLLAVVPDTERAVEKEPYSYSRIPNSDVPRGSSPLGPSGRSHPPEPEFVGIANEDGTLSDGGDISHLQPGTTKEVSARTTTALQKSLAGVAESSLLANALKNEFVKLQTNVTSLLVPEPLESASALIINFHGGGFISQSSGGHCVYLKEWVSELTDSVMLCVDYKLAPEYPYPIALNECVYAYQWALENAEKLGTRAEKVVLCGDSAGGNLAVSVALKLEALGLRKPDGICLGYPALYVNIAWSPSRLLSFFDPLLPLSILDLCLRAYVPADERPYADPFISPVVAPPSALQALPPMAIITGSLDPLLDDTVQFGHNLRSCGRECDSVLIAESLPHGFLNMIAVSKDARKALNFLSRHMSKMLEVPLRAERAASMTDSGRTV